MSSRLLPRLRASLEAQADPARALGMQAYMKSTMPYHGVRMPQVRAAAMSTFAKAEFKSCEEWRREVLAIWRGAKFREERYAAEAVQAVAGPVATSFARAAAKLQTVLGEHQDSVTAQAWLRSARATGRRAFAAGELIAMEHIAANDARAKWLKVWKALDRKRLRSWIGT